MKILITLLYCSLPFAASAEIMQIPPTELTADQARQVATDMATKKNNLKNHWQARLARAKLNDKTMAPAGSLKRPYFGDSAQTMR